MLVKTCIDDRRREPYNRGPRGPPREKQEIDPNSNYRLYYERDSNYYRYVLSNYTTESADLPEEH